MLHKELVGLKTKLGFHNCFAVDRVGFGGGLALLWMNELDISIFFLQQSSY